MKRYVLKSATIATIGLLLALPASAGHRQDKDYYDYARVIRVKPLIETVRVESSREECWTEPRSYRHGANHTPEIIGAIVGGVVGNQFGSGNGRTVATAAGAVLGGSIAHNIKVSNGYGRGHAHTATVQRCRVVPVFHTEERVAGYRVKYHYHGKTFWTRTDEHPGRHIRVRVGVRPY